MGLTDVALTQGRRCRGSSVGPKRRTTEVSTEGLWLTQALTQM